MWQSFIIQTNSRAFLSICSTHPNTLLTHFSFFPQVAYVVNELACTVTVFEFDPAAAETLSNSVLAGKPVEINTLRLVQTIR